MLSTCAVEKLAGQAAEAHFDVSGQLKLKGSVDAVLMAAEWH